MHSKECQTLELLVEVLCMGSHLGYFSPWFQLTEFESQIYCGRLPWWGEALKQSSRVITQVLALTLTCSRNSQPHCWIEVFRLGQTASKFVFIQTPPAVIEKLAGQIRGEKGVVGSMAPEMVSGRGRQKMVFGGRYVGQRYRDTIIRIALRGEFWWCSYQVMDLG